METISSKMPSSMSRKTVSILILFLSLEFSMSSPAHAMNIEPAGAVSSVNVALPQGVKVLAQVPLQGSPTTGMYTQWEHGRTYLYVEQGREQLTTVDITKKQHVQVVNHQPGTVSATLSAERVEGGPLDVSPPNGAIAGVDNLRDHGTLSVLQVNDPHDAQLLRLFGGDSSNLVDRDRHLIFFASPTRLLVVEDARWYGVDYSTN